MVDTPDNPPVKRVKKSVQDNPTSIQPVQGSVAGYSDMPATNAATDSMEAAGSAVDAQASKLAAQIAPIKEKAEKAAKAAADKLTAVDWKAHIDPIKDQAGKTAKSAAVVAKGKTGTAMQSLAKLIAETAGTVDAKLGPQYGDYARQAAESVAGAADTLDSKDVDQLLGEARDFVRKSPAVAIGAAAVVGFVLMRLAKGSDDTA